MENNTIKKALLNKKTNDTKNYYLNLKLELFESSDNSKIVVLSGDYLDIHLLETEGRALFYEDRLEHFYKPKSKYYTTAYIVQKTKELIDSLKIGNTLGNLGLPFTESPKDIEKLLQADTIDTIYKYIEKNLPKIKRALA